MSGPASLIRITALVVLLSGCQAAPSSLRPQGPAADRIADLGWFLIGTLSIVFIIVTALALLPIARRRDDSAADLRSSTDAGTRLVIGGVAVTIGILSVIFVLTLSNLESLSTARGHLTIEVTGHQWWWEVRYPDPDARRVVTTANEIHIPVGRRVQLKVTSSDVIHSFSVPQLAGMRDMIPGRTNTLWLEADAAGKYRGQCTEYCGLQHAKMVLYVIAEPEEQFAAWLERQRRPAAAPTDPAAVRGQAVYLRAECGRCHTLRVPGLPSTSAPVAPDLTHLASRRRVAGWLENTPVNLEKWILDPQVFKPGAKMPASRFDERDLAAVVTYLRTLE